jgi:2,3-bisphosphoglycerate-dependent phosphoglycerate mutase
VSVRLLLVRHGRVDFESREFHETPRGHQWDPPLDEGGGEQARRLAARLLMMDRPIAVLVSPFRRCHETLAPFVAASGARPTVVDDLGEVFIGNWEGMRFEDIVSEDEELARRFREQEPMFSLAPGGETGRQLRARVVPAVEEGLRGIQEGTVLIVSHGGVINAYLGHIMGIPHDMFFLPDNASINTVLVDGDQRSMRFLNDVRHLTDPAIFAAPAGVGEHAKGVDEESKASPGTDKLNLRVGILPGAPNPGRPASRPPRSEAIARRETRRRTRMGVKFLTEEWAKAVEDAVNSNEQFKASAGSTNAKIQQVVTTPEGEKKYWFKLEGGQAALGIGELSDPADATISQDYETAVALSKNELTGTAAYMSGKLRVSGDLMKLMQLQGALGQLPAALKDLEVEY